MFLVEWKKQWSKQKTYNRLVLFFGLFFFFFLVNYYLHKGGFDYIEGYDFMRSFIGSVLTLILPLLLFIEIIADLAREYSEGTIRMYFFEDVPRRNFIISKITHAFLKTFFIFLFLFLFLIVFSYLFFDLSPYLIEDTLLPIQTQICRTAVTFAHYLLLVNVFLAIGYLLVVIFNGSLVTSLALTVFLYFLYTIGHGMIRILFFQNLNAVSLLLLEARLVSKVKSAIILGFLQLTIIIISLYLFLVQRFSVIDILSNERR